jgi:hypothetical protein
MSEYRQLRKPTEVVRADVIAAQCILHNEVNARSDDLLALEAENQPEIDLSGMAEAKSCLKEDFGPDFEAHKSEVHPNCSLVRPVNPEPSPDSPALLKYKERQREMAEIKHFLDQDFMFQSLESGLYGFSPGGNPERDKWLTHFFLNAHRGRSSKDDQSLFNSRCRAVYDFVALWDEHEQDEIGDREFKDEQARMWKSCHYDPVRGWIHHAYNLDQCRRTSGPSHVDDGGGVALDPSPLCCEKPLGPSRYTGDATQRSSEDSQEVDRSSPVQCPGSRAELDSHNVDTDSEGLP